MTILDNPYLEMPDAELVVECQQGNRKALEVLVKRYQKIVFSILYQLAPDWEDIADLAQEIFIRVYRHIGNLRNPRTFRAWLNQITINLFYDELRKRPRRVATISLDRTSDEDDEQVREFPDLSPGPDEVVLNRELSAFIRKAMDELPEQFRVVIVLRELQGLSYEEIAESLGCELGTVKSRIARARARLQIMLKNYVEKLPKSQTIKTIPKHNSVVSI
ncbi:MAG: sigma-70 family RNA polymerase sigma factor [Candidatus Caenarcaniphilales bacterium]|nr:sigma-70 family RNA polymerase sigma factor [Candidatus Caenarcaniphilales bacterium]